MKIKFTWILSLIAITFLVSCNSSSASKNDELGKRFFENYSSRKDYKKMLSFYNDSLLYENVAQYSGGSTVDPRYLLNDIIIHSIGLNQIDIENIKKIIKYLKSKKNIELKLVKKDYKNKVVKL